MSRKCIITITPDENVKVNIETGEVSILEILDTFKTLEKGFAEQLVKSYKEATGKTEVDTKEFEEFIQFLRKNKI